MARLTALLPILLVPAAVFAAEEYPLRPDSQRQPNVPQGTVTKHAWTSKIFPGPVDRLLRARLSNSF